ncbi:MAG TPA: universal stress protein [Herpetosiphonaceae bacterium]
MTDAFCEAGATLLVALDGSPAAATALPIALALAAQLRATLEILHVVPAAQAAAAARATQPTITRWGEIKLRLEVGDPVTQILLAIADPKVVLVILTTHGRVIEPGRSLGRVAEAVVAATTRPIVLVRPEAATYFLMNGGMIHRLLLPLDGTPTTTSLLLPATGLAQQLGASIDLLYVASADAAPPDEPGSLGVPAYIDQPQHEWPAWADEMRARLCAICDNCPADVPIQVFLAEGEIGEEIAQFAAERHVDAVVLVRRSHFEAGHAHVLRSVLNLTPCPLLLIGSDGEDRRSDGWERAARPAQTSVQDRER